LRTKQPGSERVVVVGAGLAGSTAAARAAQLGRDVILLESAPDASAGGNTARSGGGVHLTSQHLLSDPDVLRERVLARGWGHARLPLVETMVSTAADAHAWFTGTGGRFQPKDAPMTENRLAPDSILEPRRDMCDPDLWPERGPQQALRMLQAAISNAGGEVRDSATAVSLSQDATGRVDGVVLEHGELVRAGTVLLADGGFQTNLALRRRFIGPRADRMFMRGAHSGMGAGLLMAEAVGARIANPNFFYGHLLHRDVLENHRLWPWPTLDHMVLTAGIIVDAHGRRFTDEGRGGIHVANALGWSDDPTGAWVIIDEEYWTRRDDSGDPVPTNPGLPERGARIVRASGIRALAAEIGLDPDTLADTLETYNAAAAAGRTGELPILRSQHGRPLRGELLAFPAVPGITFTMGGVSIDTAARVLNLDGEPIPGLHAAGGTAAGPTAGYIGGLATALVFGYIAGTTMGAI
jgi:fumarate reductase flavoprotein subunit